MNKKKVIAAVLAAFIGMFCLSSCAQNDDILRVGVKIDVPRFGYQNPATGQIEGFEVDIARELAKELKGSPDNLSLTGVNVTTRGAMLDNGTLDAALCTFTITKQRKKSYNFSQPYYTDHIGVLVKKDAGIKSLKDLDGKTIGVAQSATTKDKLTAAADELGITLKFNEYATYPEIKIALVSGRVDAFSVDESILNGYVDDTTELLKEQFAPQEYGVASALNDKELAAEIDRVIGEMQADGRMEALEKKWGLKE
ncbi:MAG: transporter substrate-binding domain-containing protein [Christensenella sp.]|uniref:transporter substrate-binding domain-containing protein n=1 Tax=Christensenella sp. TaxID=1935934 RepID=UPI002B1E997A|nr:transporter substrate-binding domain-containing protein [Christensenella sp.]MEA5002956.1 transporter substrate-binding domain-containing protein [Christensenella sp.]